MNHNYLEPYAPLLIHLLVAVALAGVLVLLSGAVGRRRPSPAKLQAYECGMTPSGDAREPFSVKFYLVAMVFILFDVEAIFLLPWALVYAERSGHDGLGLFGFVEMMMFIGVVLIGYVYLWKKGAFDWTR
jgi:NADH-quinone oxidoreductase subunit A